MSEDIIYVIEMFTKVNVHNIELTVFFCNLVKNCLFFKLFSYHKMLA